jgi:hypothetical protein
VVDGGFAANGRAGPEQSLRRLAISLPEPGSNHREPVGITSSDGNALPLQSNRIPAERRASNDLSERLTKQTTELPTMPAAIPSIEPTQLDYLFQLRSHAATVEPLDQKVEVLQQIVHWCKEKLVDSGEAMTSTTNSDIRKISDDISKNPNHIFANLYDRLELKEKEAERYEDIVVKLIGAPDFSGNKFPQPTDLSFCRSRWEEAMEIVREAVGVEDKTPDHLPSPDLAGYLTCAAENIASGRYREDELENCIKNLHEHLKSPYAVQMLMGAFYLPLVVPSARIDVGDAALTDTDEVL